MSYNDIINLERPHSPIRAHMSRLDRAAQFSPFAALTGYNAIIAENGRYVSQMAELDENAIELLNEKLKKLSEAILPKVKITYFKPDEQKAGGAYLQYEGRLKKIDDFSRCLVFEDKSTILIERIMDIQTE